MEFYVPSLKDIKVIKDALKDNHKRNCEMSPSNTVLWARHYKTEIAFWEGEIIYRSLWMGEEYSYSCNLLDSHNAKALFDQIVALDGSQSYNYYTTNFKIKVKNDCKVEITYLECNMLLTAIDTGSELWKGDVRLTGDITPNGGTSTWDVELKSSGNELWNYPLAGLKIQCKITGATFDDYTSKDYSEGYKTIFEGSSNYMETSYQNALNLYNSGKYAEAKDIFEGLGNYKDAATYLDLCEDKVFYQQMETYLHDVAGKNAILPDNYVLYLGYTQNDWYYYEGEDYRAFSADFVVNDSQVSTYLNNFRNKLTSNGFTAVSANVYKKGYTMICFSDIQEGYSSKYIDYYAWQMN